MSALRRPTAPRPRSRPPRLHLPALALLLTACSPPTDDALPEGTTRITDQSGAEFFWVCDPDEPTAFPCDVHRIAGVSPPLPPCDENEHEHSTYAPDLHRFLEVVAQCVTSLPQMPSYRSMPQWRRIVICETHEDCPQSLAPHVELECHHGFCQDAATYDFPAGPPNPFDMTSLCYGHAPWYADDYGTPDRDDAIASACPPDIDPNRCQRIADGCPDPG